MKKEKTSKVFLLIAMIAYITLIILPHATYAAAPTRIEAENLKGKFVTEQKPELSNGSRIGIDHTTDASTNAFKYSLIMENVPKTTSINMIYATPGFGDLVIYMDVAGKMQAIGDLPFTSTNGWDAFGDTKGEAKGEGFYIPEGSTITLVSTGSVNIDYFELSYDEKSVPANGDGKQSADIIKSSNVFISDMVWAKSSCNGNEVAFGVAKDRTPMLESLTVAGDTYDKGLGMLSGHFDGSVFVELNIEGLGYTTFSSLVGVADSTSPGTVEPSMKFVVEVDGVDKAHSEVMKKDDKPVELKCDITGAKKLRLYTTPAGDGVATDCGVWGNAAISGRVSKPGDPTAEPSAPKASTSASAVKASSSAAASPKSSSSAVSGDKDKGGSNVLLIAGIIAGAVIVAGTAAFIIIKNKNNKK